MSEMSSSSFDLHIGIQQIKYEIPSNFKYTKFCSIKPGKLFQSSYFQMTNLIAAGTTDGPILIYTENYDTLSQVCLLCAHTFPVTDIIQMENNYFVSSSRDGTIIKWSNDDCSFIESFPQIATKGDIILSHHQPNPNYIWINTIGFSTFLFDLINGIKIRSIDVFGITTVSYLHPDKCFYVSSPILAILKFNLFSIYSANSLQSNPNHNTQPPESIHDFAINANDHQKFFLSEYGLFRTQGREWQLFSPLTFRETFTRKVKGRISGDFISNIKWANPTTFCVSTYGSRFVIYSIDIIKNYEIPDVRSINAINIISPIESICNDFLFYTKTSINDCKTANFLLDSKKSKIEKAQSTNMIKYTTNALSDFHAISLDSLTPHEVLNLAECRIIFSPKKRKIFSLKADGTFSKNTYNKRPKMYHVPRSSSARVIETDGNSTFYVRNWEKGGKSTLKHTTTSRITSIASRESQNMKLEIIVGSKNGTISFFSENTKKPFHTEIVLSSPIIGLAHLPIKYHGRATFLAIGDDGSAALIKNNRVVMHYANFSMKFYAVFYHDVDQCIIFHRIDESFIVFKINEPGPVLLTSLLPKGSVLVWSSSEMMNETGVYNNNYYNNLNNQNALIEFDSSLSTNLVRFGNNSWFYASVGISKFLNVQHRRYKLFAKFINHLFQQKSSDEFFPHSQSLNFSSSSTNVNDNIDLTNLTNKIVDDNDLTDSDSDIETINSGLNLNTNNSNCNTKNKVKKNRIKFSNSSILNDSNSSNNLSMSHESFLSSINFNLNLNSSLNLMTFSELPKSQSIQSLVDWLSPEKPSYNKYRKKGIPFNPMKKIIQGLSLVIVGDNKKKATFFYPEYRICGSMSFILSDKNSVKNMIIKTLISGETAEEQYPELLPAFANLLTCGNYNIEIAASIECDILIDFINDKIANKLIQLIPEESTIPKDLFVLSIITIIHPNLIPRKKYRLLLSFLINNIMSNKGSSSLALSILIRGFDFWSIVYSSTNWNGKINLFIKLIDCFVRSERPKALEDIFFNKAIENLDSFFEGMKKTIDMSSYLNQDLIKKLIDLMSKIAFHDPKNCGVQITTMLVEIAAQFDQMQPLIADEIGTHSIFFTSVSILNNFIVIGRKDGLVAVYKNFKLNFTDKLFNSPVDYVSIGPTGVFCAAISVSERKAIIFALPAQGIMNSFHKRSGTEAELEPAGGHYKIYWTDPTHCHFTVVD